MKKRFWTTFVLALIGFTVLFASAGRYILKEDSAAPLDDVEEDYEEEELAINDDEEEIMFLLMGIDDEKGIGKLKEKKIEKGEYTPTGYRTDTMMLCKYNFKTGSIDILSLPRDSKVNIRGRERQEKLNHAYSHGGPYLAVTTVRDLLNVDLEYYVTVDYLAVKEIVDNIDGVDVDVPVNMRFTNLKDNPPLDINIQKGYQTLDGQTALEFLRFRSYPDGDLGRVKAQQLFMKEFMKQSLKPKNLLKLPKMAKTYYDYVDTNIPMGEALKGIGTANKVDMNNLNVNTIPGEGRYVDGISYFIYDEMEMREIVDEMFSSFLITQ